MQTVIVELPKRRCSAKEYSMGHLASQSTNGSLTGNVTDLSTD